MLLTFKFDIPSCDGIYCAIYCIPDHINKLKNWLNSINICKQPWQKTAFLLFASAVLQIKGRWSTLQWISTIKKTLFKCHKSVCFLILCLFISLWFIYIRSCSTRLFRVRFVHIHSEVFYMFISYELVYAFILKVFILWYNFGFLCHDSLNILFMPKSFRQGLRYLTINN